VPRAAAAGRTVDGCVLPCPVRCAGVPAAGRCAEAPVGAEVGVEAAGRVAGAAGRIGVGAGALAGGAGFAAGAVATGVAVAAGAAVVAGGGATAGAAGVGAATGAAGLAVVGAVVATGGVGATGATGFGGATAGAEGAAAGRIRAALAAASLASFSALAFPSAAASSSATPWICLRTFSATSAGMELECVFFSVTPYPASRSIMAFALTSSSRASSLIRTWFTSDMLIKTLPLPAAPRLSCLPRTQPLLHFRFSLRIPARLQALALSR